MCNFSKFSFYKIILVAALMVMSVNSSYAEIKYDRIGLDPEEFYKDIKIAIDSFQDYKAQINKGESEYSNDIFEHYFDSTRVYVKDRNILNLLVFLADIAGTSDLKVDPIFGYAQGCAPVIKALTELIDFLSENDRYLDKTIFSAYLVYLTENYYFQIAYLNPLIDKLIRESSSDIDEIEFMKEYMTKYPDSYSGRIFKIFFTSLEQSKAIHGYLKAPENPLPSEDAQQKE